MTFECFNQQRFRFVFLISLTALAIAVPATIWWRVQASVGTDQLRQLKLERLRLAQAVNVLEDYPEIVKLVANGPLSLDSLILSLMESVEGQAGDTGVSLHQLSVQPSNAVSIHPSIRTLRIELSARVVNFMSLLQLFDAAKSTADWRPLEIRRCFVIRTSETEVLLQAECAIDIYYSADIDQ